MPDSFEEERRMYHEEGPRRRGGNLGAAGHPIIPNRATAEIAIDLDAQRACHDCNQQWNPAMTRAFMRTVFALIPMVLAACGHCAESAVPRPKILVFAAASTNKAINEIRQQFIAQTGVEVEANYAASSTLTQQIVQGAEADVFLSADTKWSDFLAKKGLVARQRELLGNRLVIVIPADSKLRVSGPADLTKVAIEHLALAEPSSVPAGRYAKQALTQLGLWDRLMDKVAPAEDVRHALAYVETGAAEAGIVYATDAAVSKRVKVAADIPEKLSEPIRYPAVLLRHAAGNASADAFCRYLSSAAATRVFERYGFTILKPRADGIEAKHAFGQERSQ